MSKHNDLVRATVEEVMEVIESIFEDSVGDSSDTILRAIKEEICDKYGVSYYE